MRVTITTLALGLLLGLAGCGGQPVVQPANDADARAQEELEKSVKDEESRHVRQQPRARTQEEAAEEAERNRSR